MFIIPFAPALDGSMRSDTRWQRVGDTFEVLTLTPSIKRRPTYANREAAVAAGALEQYLQPSMFCAMHVNITNGCIEFHGDSR
jgi:hypothetical protein